MKLLVMYGIPISMSSKVSYAKRAVNTDQSTLRNHLKSQRDIIDQTSLNLSLMHFIIVLSLLKVSAFK